MGFAKGYTANADAVNAALKDLVSDGTVFELCVKFADQVMSYDTWVLE